MMFEVDFITLGDASEKLSIEGNNVPPATLRNWTDQLEEFNVHYTKRNNRNERIYYESDLKIFAFLRDLKSEYGRRTTTKDLAYMIADRAKEGEFELRGKEDAPIPTNKTNKTSELLGQEDIKRLMESERVRQFMEIIVRETTSNIEEKLRKEIEESNQKVLEKQIELLEAQRERDERLEKRLEERDRLLMEALRKSQEDKKESNKGFLSKLFGK